MTVTSITCREVVAFILEYLEGSLETDTRVRFERHLSLCDSCTAYLRAYRDTMRLERLACDQTGADVPEELIDLILAERRR